jgi:Fibronectin type III-like domain
VRAVGFAGTRSVAVEDVEEAVLEEPHDVVVRISSSAICGTDPGMYDRGLSVVVSRCRPFVQRRHLLSDHVRRRRASAAAWTGSAPPARLASHEPTVASERIARSSRLMTRASPVVANVALERISLGLLPALTSTGPGSITTPPESPVGPGVDALTRVTSEVVQLYGADTAIALTLPAHALVGFARVDLEPTSRTVSSVVPLNLLAFAGFLPRGGWRWLTLANWMVRRSGRTGSRSSKPTETGSSLQIVPRPDGHLVRPNRMDRDVARPVASRCGRIGRPHPGVRGEVEDPTRAEEVARGCHDVPVDHRAPNVWVTYLAPTEAVTEAPLRDLRVGVVALHRDRGHQLGSRGGSRQRQEVILRRRC